VHGTDVPQAFPARAAGRTTWQRSPDRSTWVAEGPGGLRLDVTRRTDGRWQAAIPGTDQPGPDFGTWLEAQRWCELLADFVASGGGES
jgi:hypothetical protein